MIEHKVITKVNSYDDGFEISSDMGCFWLEDKYGVTPKKDDAITVYLIQGSRIRGLDLNGKKVFYKSDEDLDRERKAWLSKHQKEKEERFKKEKTKLDNQYNKLPQCFKDRIDNFRKNSPKFRVDYESYELFCCSEAVLIAGTLKTPEKIKKFSESNNSWDYVPKLDKGHSGNTIGMATNLAYWYLQQPESIVKIAGALSPLVGSKEYEEKNKRRKLEKNEKR